MAEETVCQHCCKHENLKLVNGNPHCERCHKSWTQSQSFEWNRIVRGLGSKSYPVDNSPQNPWYGDRIVC